jgi:translocation and assembly module TamB
MTSVKSGRTIRIILRSVIGLVAFLLLLVLAVYILLQTSWGNQQLKKYAVSYLHKKLKTEIRIGRLELNGFSGINIYNSELRDPQNKVLYRADTISVSFSLSGITNKKINISSVLIAGLEANLERPGKNQPFNYDFIIKAFASPDDQPIDTSASPWSISFGKVKLERISFKYDDLATSNKYHVAFHSFRTDLSKSQVFGMQFKTADTFLDSLYADIRISPIPDSNINAKEAVKTFLAFTGDRFNAKNARIHFNSLADSFTLDTYIPELDVNTINYDQKNSSVNIHSLFIRDHQTNLVYRSAKSTTANEPDTTTNPFRVSLDTISIVNNDIAVKDKRSTKKYHDRFDPSNLDLQNFQLQASRLLYDSTGMQANIGHLSFKDQNGFTVKNISGNAYYSDTLLFVEGLAIETNRNKIDGSLRMRYSAIEKLTDEPEKTTVELNIPGANLSVDELAYLFPSLKNNEYVKPLRGKPIKVQINAQGTLDELQVNSFALQAGGNRIRGKAFVHHPVSSNRAGADLTLTELSSTKSELRSVLPSDLIPDSIWAYIPDRFNMQGSLRASKARIVPNLKIISSSGELAIRGFIDQPSDKNKAVYDLVVDTRSLKLNKIFSDTTLGDLTINVRAKGRGYDPATMKADLKAELGSAYYKGYMYHDTKIAGSIDHEFVSANIISLDPNLDLVADVSGQLGKNPGKIKVNTHVNNVDLTKLGFSEKDLAFKGDVNADIPTLDSASIDGNALISSLAIRFNNKNYLLDTIDAKAFKQTDSQYIVIHSPLVDMTMKGQYSLQTLPDNLEVVIDNYIQTRSVKPYTAPMFADLIADFHIADTMAALIPGLKKLAPFRFRALMDTRKNEFITGFLIPELLYQDYVIDSLLIGVVRDSTSGRDSAAQFVLQVAELTSPSLNLGYSTLGGSIEKGVLEGGLKFYSEDRSRLNYGIPIHLVNDPDRPYLSLHDTLVLNKARWRVSENNRIYLNTKKLQGTNIKLYSGDESITIASNDGSPEGLPLKITIKSLHLESITGILNKDSALVRGESNGEFTLNSITPLTFNTNIGVDSLIIKGSKLGNLQTHVSSTTSDVLDADIKLAGSGNDITLKGNLHTESKEVNMDLKISSLTLESLRPIAGAFVDSLKGNMNGALVIRGKTDNPSINGQLLLDSSSFIIQQTGAPISTSKAALDFKGNQILFNGMQIADSAGNKAEIAGTVDVEELSRLKYNLTVTTRKFLVAGHKRSPDQQISGPLYVRANMKITGTQEDALVSGNINVLDSSVMMYVIREDESVHSQEGLIEFFDPSKPVTPDTLELHLKNKKKLRGFGLQISSYIRVTPSSTMILVLDELAGDKLKVKGNANFNFNMDPAGTMDLVGKYEIESGSYDLSIAGLLRREFLLEKGSTITWTGDILKGMIDLHGLYKVKTDAAELVQDIESVPGISKQKFNFQVYMDLKGELLKPDITFRLDMDEHQQPAFNGIVYTRLKQINNIPADLNKQVMGLLALNTFIADNPFNSMTGGSDNIETKAYSTAGNLLTQELNDFIGNAVKDVDIDIGLDIRDDYYQGQATRRSDLKVGLAKSFSNNRLNIYVGNTFALENQNQQEDLLSGLGGDVTLEYLLTSDGRFRLKGYRLTQNDITFNGVVVETGASFVVVLEFNQLKNAFKSRKARTGKNTDNP